MYFPTFPDVRCPRAKSLIPCAGCCTHATACGHRPCRHRPAARPRPRHVSAAIYEMLARRPHPPPPTPQLSPTRTPQTPRLEPTFHEANAAPPLPHTHTHPLTRAHALSPLSFAFHKVDQHRRLSCVFCPCVGHVTRVAHWFAFGGKRLRTGLPCTVRLQHCRPFAQDAPPPQTPPRPCTIDPGSVHGQATAAWAVSRARKCLLPSPRTACVWAANERVGAGTQPVRCLPPHASRFVSFYLDLIP